MLTLLLPSLLCLPQAPAANAPVAELLPLATLCGADATPPAPVWGSLLRYVVPAERPGDLLASVDDGVTLRPEQVVATLSNLEAQAVAGGSLFLDAVSDNLLAVGDRAAVQRVRQLLDTAAQVIARPLSIEFAAWDATNREPPAAVLDAAGYERFVAGGTPLWRAVGTGRSGHAIALEHMRWNRYVRSIEVEVAQKQTMSRPATQRYGEGGHAVVRAHSLLGGDAFAVHLQCNAAVRRGVVRTLTTGTPNGADLELPALESYFAACSGRIANGGALAITMRGDPVGGGQLVLTLRVVSRTPPTQLAQDDLMLLPCGALTTNALTQRFDLPDPQRGDAEPVRAADDEGGARIDSDRLVGLVRDVAAGNGEDVGVWYGCGHLLVRGSAGARQRAEALLGTLQERLVRTAVLRHASQLVPLTPTDAETRNAANRTVHEIVLPTLFGRECNAARLFETNVISDVQIEIAAEAGILVPEVTVLQAGTWLRARLATAAQGTHLALDVQNVHTPTPVMRSVSPGGGVLMAAEVETVRVAHDGVVATGATVDHGDGAAVTFEGRTYRTALSTTLR